jgi:hypothetical protein
MIRPLPSYGLCRGICCQELRRITQAEFGRNFYPGPPIPHPDAGLEDARPFIHLAVCLTTGPKPLTKRALHTVRSRASSFKWKYPLFSLRSSSSFLHLLPRLLVTYIPPCIFPSIARFRRQFLRKMWPIHLAFRLHVDMPLHTVQHAKQMNVCCRITTLEDSNFNQWF